MSVDYNIIYGDTREIEVNDAYEELGVESDEQVTRLYFQCPRIVGDNVDLTDYTLYINYMNANSETNVYLVDDVTEYDDDTITFSWLLTRHVTAYQGTVSYIVCAKIHDGSSITNEWNTKVATGTVAEGLEATSEEEEYALDIIEQVLLQLEAANQEAVDAIAEYASEASESASEAYESASTAATYAAEAVAAKESVEDAVDLEENLVNYHSIFVGVNDSDNEEVYDSSSDPLTGRIIFADIQDVNSLDERVIALEAIIKTLYSLSLNSRVTALEDYIYGTDVVADEE